MENTSHNEEDVALWSTRDLGLAATLVCKGLGVKSIFLEYSGNRPAIGHFEFEGEGLPQVEQDFKDGKCLVEPRMFQAHCRNLKGQVMDADRNRR